jgi:hypothetical protein
MAYSNLGRIDAGTHSAAPRRLKRGVRMVDGPPGRWIAPGQELPMLRLEIASQARQWPVRIGA